MTEIRRGPCVWWTPYGRTRYIVGGPASVATGPAPFSIFDTQTGKTEEWYDGPDGREGAQRRVDELNGGLAHVVEWGPLQSWKSCDSDTRPKDGDAKQGSTRE